MSKINILDENIFNKIAAGEVVERPASVVKELLDNSIDAGAKNIVVSIVDGGIKNITVIDDGSGIEPDDFDKVFLSHATSKIKTEQDLEKIGTLGFRGEALASIASISKVKLTSKTAAEQFARQTEIEGGKQGETIEIGGDNGTTISVSDIFFNVPARAKFLKKPRTEANEITNLIERYILCNPKISFKYLVDDKLLYHSTGTNLFDAIYVVYGKSFKDEIINIDEVNNNSGIRVSGYIGLPTFSKPNRTYQTLSINNRYVYSQMVSTCVYNAYEHYLMKGQFPFYVLNLEIPFDKLDVNVHPNKMEVRFNNSNEIFGNVYNAVSSALFKCDKITTPTDFVSNYNVVENGFSFSKNNENLKGNDENLTKNSDFLQNNQEFTKKTENFLFDDSQKNNVDDNKKDEQIETKNSFSLESFFGNNGSTSFNEGSTIFNKIIERNSNQIESQNNSSNNQTMLNEISFENEVSKTAEFFDTSDIKFVGSIFNLYLIVEKQDKVYVIDEHAGHERLLFDRLVKEVDSRNVVKQNLLAPFIIDLNNQEFEFIEENIDKLKTIGFDIEQFGTKTFAINSIPSVLIGMDIKQFFDNILKDLSNMKSLKQSDLILEKLMQHSCKTAVRAGKKLSAGEVNSLIKQMKDEEMQLQCPHGRPVVVEIKKTDIEKWFKRIV